MGRIKYINNKNRTHYFYDDMVNIKDFDSRLLKLDKESYKKIAIYYIGCITKKDKYKVNSVFITFLLTLSIVNLHEISMNLSHI